MFNDVLRKPLVTLLLGAENAQILSPCKESILKSCSAAYSGLLIRQYIPHLVKFYGTERAFHWIRDKLAQSLWLLMRVSCAPLDVRAGTRVLPKVPGTFF